MQQGKEGKKATMEDKAATVDMEPRRSQRRKGMSPTLKQLNMTCLSVVKWNMQPHSKNQKNISSITFAMREKTRPS